MMRAADPGLISSIRKTTRFFEQQLGRWSSRGCAGNSTLAAGMECSCRRRFRRPARTPGGRREVRRASSSFLAAPTVRGDSPCSRAMIGGRLIGKRRTRRCAAVSGFSRTTHAPPRRAHRSVGAGAKTAAPMDGGFRQLRVRPGPVELHAGAPNGPGSGCRCIACAAGVVRPSKPAGPWSKASHGSGCDAAAVTSLLALTVDAQPHHCNPDSGLVALCIHDEPERLCDHHDVHANGVAPKVVLPTSAPAAVSGSSALLGHHQMALIRLECRPGKGENVDWSPMGNQMTSAVPRADELQSRRRDRLAWTRAV